jgi:glyoxylase-like metal-dependent hydrolase (beta-lactamase superfamily II)
VNEIAPGVFHWTAFHPNIKSDVSSYFLADSGIAVDPLLPDEGIEVLDGREASQVVLTNRHHLRSSVELADAFGVPIRCHEAGLHEFEGGPAVEGFAWGDELAPGVTALEVDAICDEESALLIAAGDGVLSVADAVINYDGLRFVPDQYLGEPAGEIKTAIREAYGRLLDEPFDTMLFGHGPPVVGGAKDALRRFVEQGP